MKRVALVMTSLAVLGALGLFLALSVYWDYFRVSLPEASRVHELYWPDQNWTESDRQWFNHTTQGTTTFPLDWFLALEQPQLLGIGAAPRFLESDYIGRFGFLPNPNTDYNPHGLPVGLAIDSDFVDQTTKERQTVVGQTCAACHSGQINYRGVGLRVDGGPANVNLIRFYKELGFALVFSRYLPLRFERFARAVLGEDYNPERKKSLKAALDRQIRRVRALGALEKYYPTTEGPGRLDALARIGNFVFGTDMDDDANFRVGDAPVSFPPLWDAPWFSWVQYNGAIRQPMMRNVSEALGVYASVDLVNREDLFDSTVAVQNLHEMEMRLSGPEPYAGLRSPRWPENVLGPIHRESAEKGKELYRAHCQRCHLPAIDSGELTAPEYWEEPNAWGQRYLKVPLIPVEVIGTDPHLVNNWTSRTASAKSLGFEEVEGGVGLQAISRAVAKKTYDRLGLTEAERAAWNGYRDDDVQALLAYKARPLNGVWATAPYLHNGSVPNLYEMLLPADRRSKTFYAGSRELDPVRVGFEVKKFPGGFFFDTETRGNSNAGHEFKDAPLGAGVIGPELTDQERWSIIEYLKSFPGAPPDQESASKSSLASLRSGVSKPSVKRP